MSLTQAKQYFTGLSSVNGLSFKMNPTVLSARIIKWHIVYMMYTQQWAIF